MTDCKKYSSGSYVEARGQREDALGCGRVRFDKVRSGTSFNIARPSFKSGTTVNKMGSVAPLRPNARKGLGNRDITRSNYIAPPIKGREILSFERLQAQDISEGGVKVQLGDKTIEKLFKVQIDDPTDVKWVEAKNARLAAGETLEQINANPPMGRPQRKVSRMTNFGAQGLSMEDKIEQVKTAVVQGNAETKQELAQVGAQISALLGNVDNLQRMTMPQLRTIYQSIMRLNIPKAWQASFRDLGRIINGEIFNQNKGPICMFLMSNIPSNRSLNQPLISWHTGQNRYNPSGLLQLFQMRGDRYLDLQDRSIDTADSLANKGLVPPS